MITPLYHAICNIHTAKFNPHRMPQCTRQAVRRTGRASLRRTRRRSHTTSRAVRPPKRAYGPIHERPASPHPRLQRFDARKYIKSLVHGQRTATDEMHWTNNIHRQSLAGATDANKSQVYHSRPPCYQVNVQKTPLSRTTLVIIHQIEWSFTDNIKIPIVHECTGGPSYLAPSGQ